MASSALIVPYVNVDAAKRTMPSAETTGLEYSTITYNGGANTGYCLISIGTVTASRVRIPEKYNNLPVVAIGERAFADDNIIKEIYIPSSI
jgi:hypothetical protein